MKKREHRRSRSCRPKQAADLFAYFVSARYFEKPGDAGRGKQAFAAKHCADCHGITDSKAAGAPPVAKWESLADPVVLAQQMWNHGAQDEGGVRAAEARASHADRAGTDRHAGLPAEPAGDPQPGAQLLIPAVGLRRAAVPIEGLRRLPRRQARAGSRGCATRPSPGSPPPCGTTSPA